jgi:hypothetical protein
MFCSVLFEGKLGSECFVRLVVKLEVGKLEAAEVVNKDGGTFVVLLGEFAFQMCKISHFSQCHLVDRDSPRFGCNEGLVVGLGFLALPRKHCHHAKQAACTLGRHHLGELLQDFTIEGKLLELREGKVTKAVVPSHELSLFVGG